MTFISDNTSDRCKKYFGANQMTVLGCHLHCTTTTSVLLVRRVRLFVSSWALRISLFWIHHGRPLGSNLLKISNSTDQCHVSLCNWGTNRSFFKTSRTSWFHVSIQSFPIMHLYPFNKLLYMAMKALTEHAKSAAFWQSAEVTVLSFGRPKNGLLQWSETDYEGQWDVLRTRYGL